MPSLSELSIHEYLDAIRVMGRANETGSITRMLVSGNQNAKRPKYKYVLNLGNGETRTYATKREAKAAKVLRGI